MDIPMKEIIASYRQQLSDILHRATLQGVHITHLEQEIAEKDKKIQELEDIVKEYEPTYGGQQDVDPT